MKQITQWRPFLLQLLHLCAVPIGLRLHDHNAMLILVVGTITTQETHLVRLWLVAAKESTRRAAGEMGGSTQTAHD